MRDPTDPPSYDPREDDFDPDIASADSFDDLATVSGDFVGIDYASGSNIIELRFWVPVADGKTAYQFLGGRGILTLEKPR